MGSGSDDQQSGGVACRPFGIRDLLAAHALIRFRRLNRLRAVQALRRLTARLLERGDHSILVKTSGGFVLQLPCDWESATFVVQGTLFEAAVAGALAETVRAGDCVVDGGAHVGTYSLLTGKIVGHDGMVIAFEPNPHNALLMRRNVQRNGLGGIVRVEEAALGSTSGRAEFFYPPDVSTYGSILGPVDGSDQVLKREVETVALDAHLRAVGRAADVIKLDVEGGELLALEGMAESLRDARVLIVELNQPRLAASGSTAQQLIDRAMELGRFDVAEALPLAGRGPQPLSAVWQDLAECGWTNVMFRRSR